MIDFVELDKLEIQFKNLSDSDFKTAYELKIKSASLQHYFGCQLSQIEKECAKALRFGDVQKAEIFMEYKKGHKVTEARESAAADKRNLNIYDQYDDLLEIQSKLKSAIKYLDKIYFICQEVTERGARRYGKDS